MEIRVVAPDVASAKALVWRLALQRSIALLDGDAHQVRVLAPGQSRQEVAEILATVEGWLDEAGIDSTDVWLEDRRHTLARAPAQIASSQ